MAKFNNPSNKKEENRLTFIPFHHPALFDRTFSAAQKSEGIICTMLCVGSIEALINDIFGWHSYVATHLMSFHENDHGANNYLKEDEQNLLMNLKSADKQRMEDKIQLFGEWDKSEILHQDFILLIRIRNSLTHIKPEELSICKETFEYTGHPKFLNNLIQRKVITKPAQPISWIESLESREYCLWCQETSYKVIQRIKRMLPETTVKQQFNESSHFFFDMNIFRERYSNLDKA